MRNYKSFLVIISFLVLTMMTGFEVKAQCPTGFVSRTVVLTVQDCDYNVQICYQCIPTYNAMYVSVVSFGKVVLSCVQNPPMTASEILDNIYAQLNNPDYIEQNCGTNIPPCDGPGSGVLYYYERQPNCWRKYNDNGNIVYEVCPDMEDTYCELLHTWCIVPDSIPIFRLTLISTSQYGYPNCPVSEPLDPDEGEHSACFYLKTKCD